MAMGLPKPGSVGNLFWAVVSGILGPLLAYYTYTHSVEDILSEPSTRRGVDMMLVSMKQSLGDGGAALIVLGGLWLYAGWMVVRYKS